ncbi:hypothetical protein [Pedobacter miscanthi]|nr:hypothetical protein [Pedobacter miscanthi]
MKLPLRLSLMALLCLLIISSCKKETPVPEKDIFTVNIDGNLENFTYNFVVNSNFMTSSSGKMMRIVGDGPVSMINININDYNGVGEYFLSDNRRQVVGAYGKKALGSQKEENYVLIDGSVKILSVTEDRIKGTFYFIATDYGGAIKKTIDGIFYLRLTK